MSYNDLKSAVLVPGQKLNIPRLPKMDVWTGTYFVPKDKANNEFMPNNYKNALSSLFLFDIAQIIKEI
ncbi:hypothetical protein skT53_32930 [Effusibacillus dendaii]|uniref:Uncharacterized protein n=1 Tax=Effusibacillus dendaii TaxID=2743772 RepID=A0A7I8DDN5_9BACL|nr:hypothetical protein skT53_32930 [Effusibacillus dendaii]